MKRMAFDNQKGKKEGIQEDIIRFTLRVYSGDLVKGDFLEDCAHLLELTPRVKGAVSLAFIEDYNYSVKSHAIHTVELHGTKCPDANRIPTWLITATLEATSTAIKDLPKLIEEASLKYVITLFQIFIEGVSRAIASYGDAFVWVDLFTPLSKPAEVSARYRELLEENQDVSPAYAFRWSPDWSLARLLKQGKVSAFTTAADLHSLTKELVNVLEKINAIRPVQFLGFESGCTYNFIRLHESERDGRIYIEISEHYDNLPTHTKTPLLSGSGHPIPTGFKWSDPVSD